MFPDSFLVQSPLKHKLCDCISHHTNNNSRIGEQSTDNNFFFYKMKHVHFNKTPMPVHNLNIIRMRIYDNKIDKITSVTDVLLLHNRLPSRSKVLDTRRIRILNLHLNHFHVSTLQPAEKSVRCNQMHVPTELILSETQF